jgi:hypothetical protein
MPAFSLVLSQITAGNFVTNILLFRERVAWKGEHKESTERDSKKLTSVI